MPSTVRAIVVELVRTPLVPVTVTVAGPVTAVPFADNVSTVDDVDDDGLNDAVTPLGKPLAE